MKAVDVAVDFGESCKCKFNINSISIGIFRIFGRILETSNKVEFFRLSQDGFKQG